MKQSNNPILDNALKIILANSPDMLFVKNKELIYQAASYPFAQLVGVDDPNSIIGKTDYEIFVDKHIAQKYRDDDNKILESGSNLINYIEPLPTLNGLPQFGATSKFLIRDSDNNIIGLYGSCRNVTIEHEAKISYTKQLSHLCQMTDSALGATLIDVTFWKIDNHQHTPEVLVELNKLKTVDDIVKAMRSSIITGRQLEDFLTTFSKNNLLSLYDSGVRNLAFEYKQSFASTPPKWLDLQLHMLANPDSGHIMLLAIVTDIDNKMAELDKLARAAEHDALTNVLNRDATMSKIDTYLTTEGASGCHAIIILDIDNFKLINDTYGHIAGDDALAEIGKILNNCFDEDDYKGRIGGDEFFILMKNFINMTDIEQKVQLLLNQIKMFHVSKAIFSPLSVSAGISLYLNDNKDLKTLYHEADTALYSAKSNGKGQYCFFHIDANKSVFASADNSGLTACGDMFDKANAPILIFHINHNNDKIRVSYASDSFLQIMGGVSRQDSIELYMQDVTFAVHPDDKNEVTQSIRSLYTDTNQLSLIYRLMGNYGIYHWVSVSLSVSRHDDGSADAFAVYTIIDDIKAKETELLTKNSLIETSLANNDNNLWFYDISSKVCTLTDNSKLIHGIVLDKLENYPRCLLDMGLIREDSFGDVEMAYAKVLGGAPSAQYVVWNKKTHGQGWWCEKVTLTMMRNRDNHPDKVVAVGQDITHIKNIERRHSGFLNFKTTDSRYLETFTLNLSLNQCYPKDHPYNTPNSVAISTAEQLFERLSAVCVNQHDKANFLTTFNCSNLLSLYEQDIFTANLEYRIYNQGNPAWLEAFIEMTENPGTHDVEAWIKTIDISERKCNQLMFNQLVKTDYEVVSQFSAETGKYLMFVNSATNDDSIPESYEESIFAVITNIVDDNYTQDAFKVMDKANVLHELDSKQQFSCAFPTKAYKNLPKGHRQWRYSYLDSTKSVVLMNRIDITNIYDAEYDVITGLYNRHAFYHHAKQRLADNIDKNYVVVRFDIDRFKAYNDLYGVSAGDVLLNKIGQALLDRHKDAQCICARIEADHFVCLVPKHKLDLNFFSDQSRMLSNGQNVKFNICFSVGLYDVVDKALDISIMCDRALLAIKSIKDSYTEKFAWYSDKLRNEFLDESMLVEDLNRALTEEEFELYFQPIVDYSNDSVISCEALVRWVHPKLGLIMPDRFIPIFEKNGFISQLDNYVWDKAAASIKKWQDQHQLYMTISVNISRATILDKSIRTILNNLIEKYSIPVSSLKLEITETSYIYNAEDIIPLLQALRNDGFDIAMDDFGYGYSSLNTLKDLPINWLKLDSKFVADCESNARGAIILRSTIKMASELCLGVICEGVETKTQAEYVNSIDCPYMQGYYFLRPMPEAKFLQYIAGKVVSTK